MQLSEVQGLKLCELLYFALLDIRQLGWNGKAA